MMEVFLLAVERSCNLEGDVILNLQQLKLTEAQEHNHHQLESKMVELLVCLQDEEPTGAAADLCILKRNGFVSFNDHMENLPSVGLGSPLERSRNMKLIENV